MGEEEKRSRRARASVVATAVALAAPFLFLGGAIAHAETTSSGAQSDPSVHWAFSDGSATTTTTPVPGPVTVASSTASDTSTGTTGTTGNTGTTGQSVQQTLVVAIRPGPLTVTPSTESVSFVRGSQGNGDMDGRLSTITVVDARGSLVGWHATVSLQAVSGVSASDLADAEFCVSPDAPTVVAGNPPEVKAGQHACASAGDPLTLFYAPPNGGGGTFTDTGRLTLRLPGVTTGSPVTATLAVAVH